MATIKALLVVLLAVNVDGYRVEKSEYIHAEKSGVYYSAYLNGECIADDVANLQTLAELLTAPHGVRINAEDVANHTKKGG